MYEEQDKQQRERIDAKNSFANSLFNMRKTVNDQDVAWNLDKNSKRIINKAINDSQEWLKKNPDASKDEYECRIQQLKQMYKREKSESTIRRTAAIKALKQTICSLRNNMNDRSFAEKLDESAKRIINKAIDDSQEWLKKNPEAGKDEYECLKQQLKQMYKHAKTESNNTQAPAIKALKQTISSLRNNMNDRSFAEKLDESAKRIINKAIDDSQEWLKKNPEAGKDEYECLKQQLKQIYKHAKTESNNTQAPAIKALKQTISSLRNNMNDRSFAEKLDESAKRIINKAIDDSQEWLKKNPEAGKDEYDVLQKKVEDVSVSALKKTDSRRAEMRNMLYEHVNFVVSNITDPIMSRKMDRNTKNTINEAIVDTLGLANNRDATEKEYLQKKEELEELYIRLLKENEHWRLEASSKLQGYIELVKNKIKDPKVAEKLDVMDKSVINQAVEDAEDWLKKNPGAGKEEYEDLQKKVECTCTPIMSCTQLSNDNSECLGFSLVDDIASDFDGFTE